jgi:hypothetical protein
MRMVYSAALVPLPLGESQLTVYLIGATASGERLAGLA